MKKEIIVTKVFNAPIESVWKIFSDPELIKLWWGPDNFTCPDAKINFREGGTSLVCMRAPEEFGGQDYYNIWSYTKIIPHTRIEYIQNLSDENGNLIDPLKIGMPADFPKDTETIVTLKNMGDGKTEMIFTEFSDFGQMFASAKLGLEQCVEKMTKIFAKL
jgi:uncharacterized protein YndB with AHSA1/START domain